MCKGDWIVGFDKVFFSTGDVPFLATDRAPVRFSPLFDGLFSAISCILP